MAAPDTTLPNEPPEGGEEPFRRLVHTLPKAKEEGLD